MEVGEEKKREEEEKEEKERREEEERELYMYRQWMKKINELKELYTKILADIAGGARANITANKFGLSVSLVIPIDELALQFVVDYGEYGPQIASYTIKTKYFTITYSKAGGMVMMRDEYNFYVRFNVEEPDWTHLNSEAFVYHMLSTLGLHGMIYAGVPSNIVNENLWYLMSLESKLFKG